MPERPRIHSLLDGPMWDSIAARRMRLQACDGCGTMRYPPSPACPRCLCPEATWVALAGTARVMSWTTFHRQYLPAYPPPHTVVVVELAEGPLMVGYVHADEAPRLTIDAAVRLAYETHPDGYAIPYFTLSGWAA